MFESIRLKRLVLHLAQLQILRPSSAQIIVAFGPDGVCALPAAVTVDAQPVVYSAEVTQNTEIIPFGDGHIYTISNAPTVFMVSTYIYTTITEQYGTPSAAATSNAPYTPAAPAKLFLGDGIPDGTVTSLPTESPVVIGWVGLYFQQRRGVDFDVDEEERLQRRADPVTHALSAVSNAAIVAAAASTGNWIVGNNPQPVSCNAATSYQLINGQLVQNGNAIGKFQGETVVALGAALTGNVNPIINVGFSFINGLLNWQAPDVGVAVWYACGGIVYAVFDPSNPQNIVAPYTNCTIVAMGGLASALCAASFSLDTLSVNSQPQTLIPSSFVVPSSVPIPSNSLSLKFTSILSIIPSGIPSYSLPPTTLPVIQPTKQSISLPVIQTTTPSIALPQTTTPSYVLPQTTTPMISLPLISTPVIQTTTPSFSLPSTPVIQTTTPNVSLPLLPSTTTPSILLPLLPSTITPGISLPATTTPSLPANLINTSSLNANFLSTPSLSLPGTSELISTPSISIPSISITTPATGQLLSTSFSALPTFTITSITFGLGSTGISVNTNPPSRSSVSLVPPSVPILTFPTTLGSIAAPSFTHPSISFSIITTPNVPGVSTPSVPSISFPSFTTLSISIPSGSLPSFSTLGISISIPSFSFSTPSLPSAAPSFTTPSIPPIPVITPSISIPSVTFLSGSFTLTSITTPSIAFPTTSLSN